MKSRTLLLSTIFAATAGLGASGNALSSPSGAQGQAAALLSPAHPLPSESASQLRGASSQPASADAQAHAAALLRGIHTGQKATDSVAIAPATRRFIGAQAQAAALLSGLRVTESSQITSSSESLGQHPAVIVAQSRSTSGIDPNTFIVAHPAGLKLMATSRSDQDALLAKSEATKPTAAAGQ